MSSPSIPVIGLSPNNFTPGTFIAVNFAQGASVGVANPISILIMGNALSSSFAVTNNLTDGYVWGPDVVGFTVSTEQNVVNTFGSGSELHREYRRVAASNNATCPVYLIAVSESAGAAASLTATFTTTATSNGAVRTYVCDQFIDTAVSTGDMASEIATNVADQINSITNLPLTASASGSGVILTAKQKGPRGNAIRVAVAVIGNVGTTSDAQGFTFLSGGTTADVWTNALATIDGKKFTYIVSPGEDSSLSGNLGELVTQVVSNAQPIPGIRQRVFAGFNGSLGSANTFAKALNTPLCDVIWQENGITPGELAAYACGSVAFAESAAIPQLNFDNLGVSPQTAALWQLASPFDGSGPSASDIASALISGVSPVRTLSNGNSALVSLITTYSQDPLTGNLDTRVRDHATVTVMFLGADLTESMIVQNFSNKLAAEDTPKGQRPPGSAVVTPMILAANVNKVIRRMNDNDLLANVEQSIAATKVVLNSPTQFGVLIQLQPIGLAHQFGVNLNQVQFIV